jgi:hypothetical protein
MIAALSTTNTNNTNNNTTANASYLKIGLVFAFALIGFSLCAAGTGTPFVTANTSTISLFQYCTDTSYGFRYCSDIAPLLKLSSTCQQFSSKLSAAAAFCILGCLSWAAVIFTSGYRLCVANSLYNVNTPTTGACTGKVIPIYFMVSAALCCFIGTAMQVVLFTTELCTGVLPYNQLSGVSVGPGPILVGISFGFVFFVLGLENGMDDPKFQGDTFANQQQQAGVASIRFGGNNNTGWNNNTNQQQQAAGIYPQAVFFPHHQQQPPPGFYGYNGGAQQQQQHQMQPVNNNSVGFYPVTAGVPVYNYGNPNASSNAPPPLFGAPLSVAK